MIARPLLPEVATLAALIDKFLIFLDGRVANHKNAPASKTYYAGRLRAWSASVGPDRPLEHIRAFHLTGDGSATPHRIQSVKRLFHWAKKAGLVEADPFEDVDQPPFGRRRRVLDRDEAARLLLGADRIGRHSSRPRPQIGICSDCADRKLDLLAVVMRLPGANNFGGHRELCGDCRRALFGRWRYTSKPARRWHGSPCRPLRWMLVALARTIARPRELREVRWRQYDSEATVDSAGRSVGAFTLTKFKASDRRGDGVDKRIIYVDGRLRALLERWRSRRNPKPDDFVFLNRSGRHWTKNALCLAVRRARQSAGLVASDGEEVVAYTWRHTSATRALRPLDPDVPPASLYELSKIMGHTNTRTTERYAHHDAGRPETIAAATAAPKRRPSNKPVAS